MARPAQSHRLWQVKAGTLCNYRCRYCYEWDRLGDRRRLPLATWRALFEAIRETQARHGGRDRIVWHGGEPLLLPPDYVLAVLALQRDILGAGLAAGRVANAVQTNLSRLNETLEVMLAAGFAVSASVDGAPGGRLTKAGRDGDAAALGNLARLRARGVAAGVLLVLGQHNLPALVPLHDRLAAMGVSWLNIVAAFDPANGAPAQEAIADPDEAVAALIALHRHRRAVGSPMPVGPLDRAAATLRRHLSGRAARRPPARRVLVEPDGRLRLGVGAPVAGRLGPGTPRLPSRAPEWAAAEAARAGREARICGACALREACDGTPLAARPAFDAARPCPVETRLVAALEAQPEIASTASEPPRPYRNTIRNTVEAIQPAASASRIEPSP